MLTTNIKSLKESANINIQSIYDENKLYKIYENNKEHWIEIVQKLYKIGGFSSILKIYNSVNNSVYIPTELEIETIRCKEDLKVDCIKDFSKEDIKVDCIKDSNKEDIKVDCIKDSNKEDLKVDCINDSNKEDLKVDCITKDLKVDCSKEDIKVDCSKDKSDGDVTSSNKSVTNYSSNSTYGNMEISLKNNYKNNLLKKQFWNLVCGSIAENFDKIQERDFIEKFSSFLLNSFHNLGKNNNNLLSFSTNYEIFLNLKFISKIIMKNKKSSYSLSLSNKNYKSKNKSFQNKRFTNKSNSNVVNNTIITTNTIKAPLSENSTKEDVNSKENVNSKEGINSKESINSKEDINSKNVSSKIFTLELGDCRFNNKDNIFNYFVKLMKLTKNIDTIIYLNCINILMSNFTNISNSMNTPSLMDTSVFMNNSTLINISEFKKILKAEIEFYLKVINFKKIPSSHTFIYESFFKDFLCGFTFIIDFNDEEEKRKLFLNYDRFINLISNKDSSAVNSSTANSSTVDSNKDFSTLNSSTVNSNKDSSTVNSNKDSSTVNSNKDSFINEIEDKNMKNMILTASNTINKMIEILKVDNNERLWNLVFENRNKNKVSLSNEFIHFMEINDISYEIEIATSTDSSNLSDSSQSNSTYSSDSCDYIIINDYNYFGFSNKVFNLVKKFNLEIEKFSLKESKKKVEKRINHPIEEKVLPPSIIKPNVKSSIINLKVKTGGDLKVEDLKVKKVDIKKVWTDHFSKRFAENFIIYRNASEIDKIVNVDKIDKIFHNSYQKRVENYQINIEKLVSENKNKILFLESKKNSIYELMDDFDDLIDFKNEEIKKINEEIEKKNELEKMGRLWKNKGLGTIDNTGRTEVSPFGTTSNSTPFGNSSGTKGFNGWNKPSSLLNTGDSSMDLNNYSNGNESIEVSSGISTSKTISPFGLKSGLSKDILDAFNVKVDTSSSLSNLSDLSSFSNYKKPSGDVNNYLSGNEFKISDELLSATLSSVNEYTQKIDSKPLDNKWTDSKLSDNKWTDSKLSDNKWTDSKLLDNKWTDSKYLGNKSLDNAEFYQYDTSKQFSEFTNSSLNTEINSILSSNSNNPFNGIKDSNSIPFGSKFSSTKDVSSRNSFIDSKTTSNVNFNQYIDNNAIDKSYSEFNSNQNLEDKGNNNFTINNNNTNNFTSNGNGNSNGTNIFKNDVNSFDASGFNNNTFNRNINNFDASGFNGFSKKDSKKGKNDDSINDLRNKFANKTTKR